MPKKLLQKYFPSPEQVRSNPALRFLHPLFARPNLWHINRHSVARAFIAGLFFAFLPIPFQMFFAAVAAFWLNANLPISVGLVWITNPLTMPPVFYATYRLGNWMLGIPSREFHLELSVNWLLGELNAIWLPLMLGSLTTAIIMAAAGYFSIHFAWRLHILRNWEKRRLNRLKRAAEDEGF